MAAAVIIISPAVAWSAPDASAHPVITGNLPFSLPQWQGAPDSNSLLAEANKARKSAGMQPLRANRLLSGIAQQRADDMSLRQYYSHKSPDDLFYYDIMARDGLKPSYSCENLNLVFTYSDARVISDWLESKKGHKECLLNSDAYETGIAVVPYNTATYNSQNKTIYLVVAIHSTNL